MGVLIALILLGVLGGSMYSMRRFRDPRLDRDWSDDEATPYDSPSSPQMNAEERMLDEPKPPDY